MKLLLTSFLLVSMNVHASYFATHCSNADASIKWESGHNSNTISIKDWSADRITRKIELNKVEIKVDETHVIKDETTSSCMHSRTRIYVGNASITASPDYPTALDFLSSDVPLKAVVICEFHINSRGQCPPKP